MKMRKRGITILDKIKYFIKINVVSGEEEASASFRQAQ